MATNFFGLSTSTDLCTFCFRRRGGLATLCSAQTPPPLKTKVVLPKKEHVKLSIETESRVRKYWGGGDPDPVNNMNDFIWNKDFVPHVKRMISGEPELVSPGFKKEPTSGFLSLNRFTSLDSMEIDLSKELQKPPEPFMGQVELARRGISTLDEESDGSSPRWSLAPTKRQQGKWDRATRALTKGTVDVILRESKWVKSDPKLQAAKSMERYNNLKSKMQTLTLGIGGVGAVSAYFTYSPEIAASFCIGLVGSLVYIRMLGRTVDSMANSSGGLMRGAVGQPRLLVPLLLVMIYNRWNAILAPQYGFMHLELIPMLVGFFTYKIATFIQALEDSLSVVERIVEKPEI